MKYKFTYQTTALDLWKLSMYYTYGSIVGVCNIIFTVAMIILTGNFWGDVNIFLKILLIMGSCLFTVIQPIIVYMRAKKQIAKVSQDMEIGFDDNGIHVKSKNQSSDLKWKSIKGAYKKPSMIVIYSTAKRGFILTNKVLGKQKEEFYDYVISKIKK
ncbi:YcxB family protein [Clostridium sp. D2Q-14]|uniref:YcxB family protein n=1 Tax=Anaeromonas gelatinilytica TaxID=2683194 RepID=UPI00193B5A47|nr:YcxB family protein [Anaeromonas gelatinilytica]MBS4535635.1 YcxB family protein [Anaeromonas gelatinilytica]